MTTQHLRSHTTLAGTTAIASVLLFLLTTGACGDDFEGSAGQGAAVVGGSGAIGGGGTGGSGADAGSGGTGGQSCIPDETQPCYTGPDGTRGVGNCTDGEQTCTQGGTWGACVGDILPAPQEDCNLQGDEDCDGAACADARWAIMGGDSQEQIATSVAINSEGDVIVAGWFQGSISQLGSSFSSAGAGDVFLAKLDGADGTPEWVHHFGGTGEETAPFVVVDSADNILMTGGYQGTVDFGGTALVAPGDITDIYLVKFSSAGDHVWSRFLTRRQGGLGTINPLGLKVPAAMAIDGNDNVVIGGWYTEHWGGMAMLPWGDAEGRAAFLRKGDSEGDVVWSHYYDSPEDQQITAVTCDAGGNVVIAGRYEGSITLGGYTHADPAPGGEGDGFIADVSSSGSVDWSDAFGAASNGSSQWPRGLLRSASGITVVGHFEGAIAFDGMHAGTINDEDMFLAGYPNAGSTPDWFDYFGNDGKQWLLALGQDSQGRLVVGGGFAGSFVFAGDTLTAQAGDAFIAKLDQDHDRLWSRQYGIDGLSPITALDVGPSDEIAIAGFSTGDMDFATGEVLLNSGQYDLFVALLEP